MTALFHKKMRIKTDKCKAALKRKEIYATGFLT
jgi:hypothetical protein